jgi:hypothetical protein
VGERRHPDLVLYLIGEGDEGTFRINETESVTAADLDGWLDSLQEDIPGKVTVIVDACRSGSFLTMTANVGKERILLASAGADQAAYFASSGDISFSRFFWAQVLNGASVRDAFLHGKWAIEFATQYTPSGQIVALLDDTGNGVGNEKEDGRIARNTTIGEGIILTGDDPVIGEACPGQSLYGSTSAGIWVDHVASTRDVARVWAAIIPPGQSTGSPADPLLDLPTVDLTPVGSGRYEGAYSGFSQVGTYEIAVFAEDADGNVSLPKDTWLLQQIAMSTVSPLEGTIGTEVTLTGGCLFDQRSGDPVGPARRRLFWRQHYGQGPVFRHPKAQGLSGMGGWQG